MSDRDTMLVGFPGGLKVAADYQGMHIVTDQPREDGGDGSAPAPFDLFLAAIGTCAGYYVLKFCQARELPLEGVQVRQRMLRDPETKKISGISLDVELPASFPGKYRDPLVRAVRQCAVKRAIDKQLSIEARAVEV